MATILYNKAFHFWMTPAQHIVYQRTKGQTIHDKMETAKDFLRQAILNTDEWCELINLWTLELQDEKEAELLQN